jgi:hypothetical protein
MMFFGTGNAWHPYRPYSAVPVGGGAAPLADAPAQSDGVRAAFSNFLDLISASNFTVRTRPERHTKEQA